MTHFLLAAGKRLGSLNVAPNNLNNDPNYFLFIVSHSEMNQREERRVIRSSKRHCILQNDEPALQRGTSKSRCPTSSASVDRVQQTRLHPSQA
jgi:hypothetical protein